jgi:lipopolysaccharide transport system ATP-binding protein
MSDIVIHATDLGKKYIIGHANNGSYTALRDVFMQQARGVWQKTRDFVQGRPIIQGDTLEEVWVLRDVSFEIRRGEAVGIIGRNGAGKSTLLKILSRITPPSSGRVTIKGQVASLLEVGTGFHPELTGRENIYLNGAILGMTRAEIKRKFDEIVAFAGIEQFLDTPVKRYSSGMYVRLAFAVAAHLEPEILIVDEVLAVGDAAFQRKCLGKMGEVARNERTVLFVSHNMAAVSALCSKAIVLKNGTMQAPVRPVEEAVQQYWIQVNEVAQTPLEERPDRKGAGKIRITHFAAFDDEGNELEFLASGQHVRFSIYYKCVDNNYPQNIVAAISITARTGEFITMLCNHLASEAFDAIPQQGIISCIVRKLPLSPGRYTVNLTIRQNDIIQDWVQEAVILSVEGGDFYGTGKLPPPTHAGVLFEQSWLVSPAKKYFAAS